MNIGALFVLAILLAACDAPQSSVSPKTETQSAHPFQIHHSRHLDKTRIKRGKDVYQQFCASCHGKQAEGHPRWQWLGPDGKFPPPPLNGNGHTWHHPMTLLQDIIKNGIAQGNMPGWKNKLSDEQIDDVIAWFISLWPNDSYKSWYELDQRITKGGSNGSE